MMLSCMDVPRLRSVIVVVLVATRKAQPGPYTTEVLETCNEARRDPPVSHIGENR